MLVDAPIPSPPNGSPATTLPRSAFGPLSLREQEVLRFLADGKTSKAIASHLYVTTKTIVWHRQNIMHKLGIRTIAGLTKYAVRTGLTTLD
ncbi:MAG: helix-turn-helix transcriptional regulator [Phycisphaerales bacterium]|nr:helix-turn-helix transcriptional regulator [Phycisphaerales bacterium]